MKLKNNVFVCTRPIQYLNLKGIVEKNKKEVNNILFVFANFNKGEEFTQAIKKNENCWNEVYFINSKFDLIKKFFIIKIYNLYLSNDLGFNYLISVLSFSKHVYVYEEGWATYMKISEKATFKVSIQKYLYNIFGSGDHIGNSINTDGVIVYNSNLYKKNFPKYSKKVISFKNNFITQIENEQFFFNNLYKYKDEIDFSNKKILIYATGWQIDQKVLKEIKEIKDEFDFIFLKLHPHIKNNNLKDYFFITLKQNVMLEFYLQELLKKGNEVTVFHDNSFSVLYFNNQIKTKNIGRFRKAYCDIEKLYINHID